MVKVRWNRGPRAGKPARRISGVIYRQECKTNSKLTAKSITENFRRDGYLARVSKLSNADEYRWGVYTRVKRKWRKK